MFFCCYFFLGGALQGLFFCIKHSYNGQSGGFCIALYCIFHGDSFHCWIWNTSVFLTSLVIKNEEQKKTKQSMLTVQMITVTQHMHDVGARMTGLCTAAGDSLVCSWFSCLRQSGLDCCPVALPGAVSCVSKWGNSTIIIVCTVATNPCGCIHGFNPKKSYIQYKKQHRLLGYTVNDIVNISSTLYDCFQ